MFNKLKKNFQVVSNSNTQKTFNYSKGKVHLNFTLRIDIKSELKDFKKCLENALIDVGEELDNLEK